MPAVRLLIVCWLQCFACYSSFVSGQFTLQLSFAVSAQLHPLSGDSHLQRGRWSHFSHWDSLSHVRQCCGAFFCEILLRTNNLTYSFDGFPGPCITCENGLGSNWCKGWPILASIKNRLLVKSANVVGMSHKILHASNMTCKYIHLRESVCSPAVKKHSAVILFFSFLSAPRYLFY